MPQFQGVVQEFHLCQSTVHHADVLKKYCCHEYKLRRPHRNLLTRSHTAHSRTLKLCMRLVFWERFYIDLDFHKH